MFMILFTSGSACVSFYLFGAINMDAGAILFVMGLVCTAFGQCVSRLAPPPVRLFPPSSSVAFHALALKSSLGP